MFYTFMWHLCRAVLKVLRRWKVEGHHNIPEQGGVVVAANHRSYWDPVVVGCAMTRKVRFIAKADLFRIPVFRNIIRGMGSFPVKREGVDREGIRTALHFLQDGKAVGIFPEGTRSKTEELLEPQMGAALIALKADVPIVPTALINTPGILRPIKVVFGKPMYFSELRDKKLTSAVLKEVSARLMAEIGSLLRSER